MIRVTIDMIPLGIGEPRHMATIEIVNDVAETVTTGGAKGSYTATFSRISQRGERLGNYDKIARISGINRHRSGAVYRILHQVLGAFLEE